MTAQQPFQSQDTLLALQQLQPLSSLLWREDKVGGCFLIKVPSGVEFSELSIIFEKPEVISRNGSGTLQDATVTIIFSIQVAPGQARIHHSCVFRLNIEQNERMVRLLSQASTIRVMGFTSGPLPRYIGVKKLNWLKSHRKTLLHFLAKKPQDQHKKTSPAANLPNAMLISEIRETFSSYSRLLGFVALRAEKDKNIGIYIVLPTNTHFEMVAMAFEALTWNNFPTGHILSLLCFLQDKDEHILRIECILDPRREGNILQILSNTKYVEVTAFADSPDFPVIGRKQFGWAKEKRVRSRDLFDLSRKAGPTISWREALMTFLEKYQIETTFRDPKVLSSLIKKNDSKQEDRSHSMKKDSDTFHTLALPPSSSSSSRKVSLIEHSILLYQAGAQQEFARLGTLSRGIFWRMLFALALEQTPRKYIWTPEAVTLIEEHRQQLIPDSRTPWLSSLEHVWIEFPKPIAMPAGYDIAALAVFAPADTRLLQKLQQRMGISASVLTRLEHTLYNPGKHCLIFNVIDNKGRIVWAIGLNTIRDTQPDGRSKIWGTAPWFFCPNPQCLLHTQAASTLCESCTVMRTFVWTWLLAARQSLLGLYRERPGETDQSVEGSKHEKVERMGRILLSSPEDGREELLKMQHQYRVVRSIDIAVATDREGKPSQIQRGSWVEALAAIDPALIFFDEREIPLTTRTLKDPRYARYIAEHGTNQIEVKAHTRHIPMRADSKRMTRVTARKKQNNPER